MRRFAGILYAVGAVLFVVGTGLLFAAYAPSDDLLEAAGQIALISAWALLVVGAIVDVVTRRDAE